MNQNQVINQTTKPNSPFVRYPNTSTHKPVPTSLQARGSVQVPRGPASREQASPSFPGGGSVQVPHAPASQDRASLSSARRGSINLFGIVKFLLDMKYAKKRQLLQRFGQTPQTEADIGLLLDRGWIKSRDREMTADTLFVPTMAGYNALLKGSEGKLLAQPLTRIFEPTVRHNVLLGDIRIKFEELGFIKKWNSEEMLKLLPGFTEMMPDVPDAMCERRDGPKYFLELEISQKSKKVYEDRVAEYERILQMPEIQDQGITGVMFLCTDRNVLEILKSLLPKENKLFSALPLNRYLKNFEMTNGRPK